MAAAEAVGLIVQPIPAIRTPAPVVQVAAVQDIGQAALRVVVPATVEQAPVMVSQEQPIMAAVVVLATEGELPVRHLHAAQDTQADTPMRKLHLPCPPEVATAFKSSIVLLRTSCRTA